MRHPASSAEFDPACPLSDAEMRELYGADVAELPAKLARYSEVARVKIALYGYPRAHLRPIALQIAATVDPDRLVAMAGVMGTVLAEQSRATGLHWGVVDGDPRKRPKKADRRVSLGGGAGGSRW